MKTLLKVILGLYLIACGALYAVQEKVLFLPDTLPENHRFRLGSEVEIEVEPDISLNCVLIETPSPDGVILYLHGNKGSNRRCLRQAITLTGFDYDIFMPDYRGYGKSDGEICSEEQMYSDAQKVYDYLKEKYGEDRIVVVGYSIGTSMATYLAAHNQPKQLVLNSPFISICNLKDRRVPFVLDLFVKYHFNNKKHLEMSSTPTQIFHGTSDELIPYDSAETLVNIDPSRIQLTPLQNTGHRRAIFSDTFRDGVGSILRQL